MEQLGKTRGPTATKAARRVAEWARQHLDWHMWGTGARSPSLLGGLHDANNNVVLLIASYPGTGKMEVPLSRMKRYPPFDDPGRRHRLLAELNQIPGVALPGDRIDGRPSFDLALLADDSAFAHYTSLIEEAVGELRLARSARSS
jgi:hypothetical protein